MQLTEYRDALTLEAAVWWQGLENDAYPLDQLGRLSLDVSTKLRAVGIAALLLDADPDSFRRPLTRSGEAREIYLRRLRDAQMLDDHHFASGRFEPLLDAIAAGDLQLARRIVDLSPSEWREGHEYEDDYCFAQVLHGFVRASPSQDITPLLTRFETYLAGEESARLTVCRALAISDQEAFDAAFEARLRERRASIAADKERGRLEEPEIVTEQYVFVEALALLRIAELRGLSTQEEYPYCPSVARLSVIRP